ncbi:VCBS domain-containing protein, partial [Alcaligenaceae bacterium C4P045]|nr:VCBS domain-containing protein [Alcaligenaceae bacterium C4P045]
GTVSQVTVTVIGTNDAAVIAGQGTGTVTEDQTTTASGTLTVTDADAGQATFTAQTGTAGTYGSFSIGTDGAWTYTLNNAAANVQALAQGEQRQEIFTVTSADGTVSQVTVTVIGTNDAAVIAGQGTGTVTEDSVLTASGTLTVTDADAGQATFTAQTGTAGTYGSFSIGTDGAWTYTLNNTAANVQALAQGEQRQEMFTVTSADGTVSQVTVTVIGTNDAAVIAGQGTGNVTEDTAVNANGSLVSTGMLTISDADAGQSTFQAGTAVPVGSTLGSLSITANGAWTYNVANSDVQYLAAGQTKVESFTVSAADGTTTAVTVTITGTNDVPTFAGAATGTVTEDTAVNVDGNLVSSGTLIVTDADAGQSTFQAGTAVPVGSTLGSLSIAANGTWIYNVANNAVQYLAAGETKTESFTVAAADGTTTIVTVTITGTNDVPTFTGVNSGAVTQDNAVSTGGDLVSSGSLVVADADADQSTFKAGPGVPVGSTLGSLSIAENGTWTYNVANSAVQYLAAGETKTESFTVFAADGTTTVVTVTITGTNDVPTFSGTSAGSVTEDNAVNVDGNLVSSGTLTIADADAGQSTFKAGTAIPVGSTLGSLSIAENGTWTYNVANSAVQYLAAGQTKVESFTVSAADGTTTVVTVTITGTNDVPTFSGAATGTVTEDTAVNANGNLVSSGTLTISDADAGQSTFKAGTAVPVGSTLGSLSIAENGTWTYNVAYSAVQYLAAGQTKAESFTVSAADGTTTVVTVTITGTDDVPTFTGAATGTVTEDTAVNANGNLVSSGTLTISDADAGQSTFKAGTAVPVGTTLGSLSIAENGTWTYNVANSAVQYLAAGQTKTESFTVSAADGTTTVVTVTITGTNDVPTFAGAATGTVTEDTAVNANGNLVSSGTLTISDADAGQSTFKAGTAVPVGTTLGSLSIAENGTWTYNVANSAVQYLAAGQTKTESFTVAAADGTTTVVTVTITGTNDVPTFAGAVTGTVTEDTAVNANGNLVSSGTLTISDADAGQSTFKAGTAVPVGSTLGSLSIAENGTWTYNVANSAVQYLAAGQTKVESFTVSAADGTTTVVTVTITGTNDVPTFAGAATGTVTEDTAVNANGNLVSSGTLTISDADAGQGTFKAGTAVSVGSTLGSLSIAENGTWTYNVANSAVQYLAAGQTKTESFTVSAADGTTTVITVTITGTNDVPTFAGAATGTVTEDTAVNANGNLVSSGTLTISDADAGQSTFKAGTAAPVGSTLGSLSIAENGTWTYNVANSAVQYLAAGQTKVESFTVSAADGTTTVVTVTITGTNDVPTFAGAATGTVTEDTAVNANGNLVSSGTLTISDADAGQSTFKAGTAVPVGSTLGSLSIAENGTWTYNIANSAVQYLAAGQTKIESFTVSAADGTTTVVTVTITGTNDVPTFAGAATGTVTEDTAVNANGNLVSSGALTISDADAGQSTFKAGTAVPVGSTLGSLSVAENGTWTYNVANSAVQYLAAGQTKVEAFTVAAADGTTTVVTVTITGTNDVPTFAGAATGTVTEDTAVNANGNLVSSGTLTISDADAGQSTFKPGTAVPVGSTLGSLSIAENGTWTYNVANSAVQYLAAGQTKIESFTVSAADGTTTVVTVTITGTNDVPTFAGAATGTVNEDTAVNANGNLVSSGTMAISDADAGQSTFKAGAAVPVGSSLGSLSIAENGTWTYNVANSAVQYLAAGQTKVESFTVAAADGTTTVVTVTITGTNDVPTFSGTNAGAVTEDTAVNANGNLVSSGTLTISDADAGQSSFKAGTAVPVGTTLGSLSIAENGTWTYNVSNSAVQYLAAGQTKVESFTVAAADGTTTVVTVTITGTNDVPTFAGAATGTVTEDTAVNANGNLVSSGTLTISDADAGQNTFKAGTAVPVGTTLGSLSIAENGTWTYNVANSAVQYLAAGQTKVESFTVSAADGTTTVVMVTITGTNDVPTFTGAATGTVTEDTAVNANGNLVSSGTLTISDADAGQNT